MGKKLTDGASDHASFSKKELPKETRVIEGEGGMMTMDHKPDRYVRFCVRGRGRGDVEEREI